MTDQNELNRQDTTAPDDGAVVMEEVMPEEKVDFPPEEDLFDQEDPGQGGLPLPEKEPAERPSAYGVSKRTMAVLFLMAAVILSLIGLIIGILVGRQTAGAGTSNSVLSEASVWKLTKIRSIVDEYFLFDDKEIDFETGVIRGYMGALDDPYSVYYTPEEYVSMMESTSGTFSGIGVVVQQDPETGNVLVMRPYSNCPGAEAGIREGDVILEVDGQSATGVDLNIVVTWIKGEIGTSVHLKMLRPSTNEQYEVDVKRAKIEVETISSKMLDDHIGYIQMESFDEVTYQQFMNAFDALKKEGMKGLIVDIRFNGGGLLSSVTRILDRLLPEGIVTYTEDKNGKRKDYKSDAASVLDVPMVVLVNEYSASASEIFTGALKDYEAATIVGTTTFGKGIVQVILELGDGSAVKVTTSRYFTPKGVCIHGIGIEPDVYVEDDLDNEEDEQLDAAIEELKKKMQ